MDGGIYVIKATKYFHAVSKRGEAAAKHPLSHLIASDTILFRGKKH
jgi:hypothetical protein